jgi:eukaryotic-like serine/threonine-protein kinase
MGAQHAKRDEPHAQPTSSRAVIDGRYDLTHEIARGGCAVVFEARDRRVGRVVAVKLPAPRSFDEASVARLRREARLGASLHHPNVCAVTDAGWREDGTPFLVMERLYGETLGAHIARVGRTSVENLLEIALQLLAGLGEVHARGFVHRDVKPDNVFLVHRHGCAPLVKLIDFGVCCRTSGSRRDEMTLTSAGTVIGTPEYMAPEQASGERWFHPRIDLFAVGVVLYEALTGGRPFAVREDGTVPRDELGSSLARLREIRPDLPAALEAIVARAMAFDRRERYRTAMELQRDLLEVLETFPRSRQVASLTPADGAAAAPASAAVVSAAGEWELPTRRIRAAPIP